MFRRTALTISLAAVLATLPCAPAQATPDLAIFALPRAGTLTITTPATAYLGGAARGSPLTKRLATITVSDTRAPGSGDWTATVSSTNYTRTTSPAAVINREYMSYWSGPATAISGGGTFTPGQLTAAQRVPLDTARTAFSHSKYAGINSASWTPTLQLSIPLTTDVIPGTYTGTITHSVG